MRRSRGPSANAAVRDETATPIVGSDSRHVASSRLRESQRHVAQSNLATFNKFFRWLGATSRVSPDTVAAVVDTLREDRAHFLAAVRA